MKVAIDFLILVIWFWAGFGFGWWVGKKIEGLKIQ